MYQALARTLVESNEVFDFEDPTSIESVYALASSLAGVSMPKSNFGVVAKAAARINAKMSATLGVPPDINTVQELNALQYVAGTKLLE